MDLCVLCKFLAEVLAQAEIYSVVLNSKNVILQIFIYVYSKWQIYTDSIDCTVINIKK